MCPNCARSGLERLPDGHHTTRLLLVGAMQLGEIPRRLNLVRSTDDVVAVEHGPCLVPGQRHCDHLGDASTHEVANGRAPGSCTSRPGTPAFTHAVRQPS